MRAKGEGPWVLRATEEVVIAEDNRRIAVVVIQVRIGP